MTERLTASLLTDIRHIKSGIHVAEYLTVLPPCEALQAKLHQSIATARAGLDDKRGP